MSALFFFLLAVSAVLAAPAWYFARRDRRWFVSDYFTVFIPLALWFVLVMMGVGSQSLSNLVEVLGMAVFNPLMLTVRVFILDRLWPRPAFWSSLCLGAALFLPLVLRLTMPILPE